MFLQLLFTFSGVFCLFCGGVPAPDLQPCVPGLGVCTRLVNGPVLHSTGAWMGDGTTVSWERKPETGEDESVSSD